MYFCPTDDIHSVYLDSELPPTYLHQYEAHVKNCKKCAEKIDRLQKTRLFFAADSRNISPDAGYLAQSFDRLQTKLRHSKHTAPQRSLPGRSIRIGIAAAAAIAAAAIPMRGMHRSASAPQEAPIIPVSQPHSVPIARQNVVINGNIHSNLAHTVNTSNLVNTSLTGIEMFRPEFMNKQNVTPKPPMPWFDSQAAEPIEIKLPENREFSIEFVAGFQE
ncbi:MAG: hypothetical protein K2H09_04175 [Treponemataceae bacterium]|nr:hypothetical protein [Treponemataceae bacterium]